MVISSLTSLLLIVLCVTFVLPAGIESLSRLKDALVFGVVMLSLEFLAFVREQCGISVIVDQLIILIYAWHRHLQLCAPPVPWQCLDLGNSSCGMILGAEYVAINLMDSSTQGSQDLGEHASLDGHVQ